MRAAFSFAIALGLAAAFVSSSAKAGEDYLRDVVEPGPGGRVMLDLTVSLPSDIPTTVVLVPDDPRMYVSPGPEGDVPLFLDPPLLPTDIPTTVVLVPDDPSMYVYPGPGDDISFMTRIIPLTPDSPSADAALPLVGAVVPEPSVCLALGLGLCSLGFARRKSAK